MSTIIRGSSITIDTDGSTPIPSPSGGGTYSISKTIAAGYITASGNYIAFFIPMYIPQNASVSVDISAIGVYALDGVYTDVNYNSISVIQANRNGVKIEMNFNNTKTGNRVATVHIDTGSITIS